MLKLCNHCGQEKAIDQFNWRWKAAGIKQSTCRDCQNRQKSDWYERNKEEHNANTQQRKVERRVETQAYIWEYLSTHPCVDCGETDPVVLEFDHVRGVKKASVTMMAHHGYQLSAIMEEIEKCVVRCANCHRRRTYKGTWRG
jgi:hypothetical protein